MPHASAGVNLLERTKQADSSSAKAVARGPIVATGPKVTWWLLERFLSEPVWEGPFLAQLDLLLGGTFGGWEPKQLMTFIDPKWTIGASNMRSARHGESETSSPRVRLVLYTLRPPATDRSSRQLVEQGLGLLQVERIEALREPAVGRMNQP